MALTSNKPSAQIGCLRKSGARQRQIDAAWKRQISDVPAGVKRLRQPYNIAFLAIWLDAWEWPDVSLCSCLLQGFQLAGDLSALDSNIFTPKGEGEAYENSDRFEKGWVELQNHESNLNWLSECEQVLLASGRKAQQVSARDPQSEALLRTVMDPTGVSTTPKSLASTTAQSLQNGCCCHRLSLLERWQARYFARRKLHQSPASSWAQRTFEALIADSETRLQITLSLVSIT